MMPTPIQLFVARASYVLAICSVRGARPERLPPACVRRGSTAIRNRWDMDLISWLFGSSREEPLPSPPLSAPASGPQQSQWQQAAQSSPRLDVEKLAAQHGVSAGAIETLVHALSRSQGRAAQFSHPELGGMGQWMSGGMLMIGDMFNHELKAKVDRVCHAVAVAIGDDGPYSRHDTPQAMDSPVGWWPAGFGTPSAAGSQNAMRYAFFPAVQRLVIDDNGAVSIYDTGDTYLMGTAQQQSGSQLLEFTSTEGRKVSLSEFRRVPA